MGHRSDSNSSCYSWARGATSPRERSALPPLPATAPNQATRESLYILPPTSQEALNHHAGQQRVHQGSVYFPFDAGRWRQVPGGQPTLRQRSDSHDPQAGSIRSAGSDSYVMPTDRHSSRRGELPNLLESAARHAREARPGGRQRRAWVPVAATPMVTGQPAVAIPSG